MKIIFTPLSRTAFLLLAVVFSLSNTANSQHLQKIHLQGTWTAATECIIATLIFDGKHTAVLHWAGAGRDVTYKLTYHLGPSGIIKFRDDNGKAELHLIQTLTKNQLAIRPYPISKHIPESIDLIDELNFTKQL
jgi:hypothetical protein